MITRPTMAHLSTFRAHWLCYIAFAIVTCSSLLAQTKLVGEGTTVSPIGTTKFKIEIVVFTKAESSSIDSSDIARTGTIRIWSEERELVSRRLYITRSGDTKAWSLVGFYIDQRYPATIRIDTW